MSEDTLNGSLPAGAEGWEFHLLAVGLALVVLLRGSGALSVDLAFATREAGRPDARTRR